MSPYGVSSTGYVTFEDPHSSAVKSRWVKDNGYAGIMVWEVSHDYIEGTGNPILDSIYIALQDANAAIRPKHNKAMSNDGRKTRATDLKGRNVPPKAARGAYYPVNGK